MSSSCRASESSAFILLETSRRGDEGGDRREDEKKGKRGRGAQGLRGNRVVCFPDYKNIIEG